MKDARVYAPKIRDLLGTASHFCEVVVLKLRTDIWKCGCTQPAALRATPLHLGTDKTEAEKNGTDKIGGEAANRSSASLPEFGSGRDALSAGATQPDIICHFFHCLLLLLY